MSALDCKSDEIWKHRRRHGLAEELSSTVLRMTVEEVSCEGAASPNADAQLRWSTQQMEGRRSRNSERLFLRMNGVATIPSRSRTVSQFSGLKM